MKHTLTLLTTLLLAPLAALHAADVAAKKPNIVLVLTDDQGYGDFSLHGNPLLKTPNLDRFAREGLPELPTHPFIPLAFLGRRAHEISKRMSGSVGIDLPSCASL